jgi:hypothetical protein
LQFHRAIEKRVFMAKSSVPRHSKAARKPVTIELESVTVTRKQEQNEVPEPEPVGFAPMLGAKQDTNEKPQPEPASAPGETKPVGRDESSNNAKYATRSRANTYDSLGRVIAGIIGGAMALIGAAGLQWAGVLPSPRAGIAELEQQIEALRNAPATGQSLDEGAQTALNDAVENAKRAADQVTALSAELGAIKQSVTDIQTNAGSAAPAVDTGALDARIAALENRLNVSQQQAEQAGGAAAGATERLNALEAKVNDTSEQTNMALAMAATGLKAAIDRGGPFAAELDTYLAVAPASGDVESLRPFAAKGIPTAPMLASQLDDVAPSIIASSHKVDPDAGVLDRLWASATNLVQARPIGMVEGEGVDAVTARIEAHLDAGDLRAAILEWEKLPENAKAVSMDFANAVKARQRAGEVVSKALSDALAGIKSPAAAN